MSGIIWIAELLLRLVSGLHDSGMTKKQKKELREEFRSLKTSLVQKKGDLQKDKQDIALQKANKMAAKEERMTVSLY